MDIECAIGVFTSAGCHCIGQPGNIVVVNDVIRCAGVQVMRKNDATHTGIQHHLLNNDLVLARARTFALVAGDHRSNSCTYGFRVC